MIAVLIVEDVRFFAERDIRNLSPARNLVELFVVEKFIFENFIVEIIFSHIQSVSQNF